ncbi:MAG: hypothetical protein AAF639_41160 [Chloroflexota bacterium]
MAKQIKKLFRSPYSVPNGLQATSEGLWVADQITDRLALVELTEPPEKVGHYGGYGVTKLIWDIPSESSNTSGMAIGGGALWLAANGAAQLWRPARETDAKPKAGAILKVDPATGQTMDRWLLPDPTNVGNPEPGGTHGIEYDPFEEGILWLTTLKSQTVSKVRIDTWEIEQVIDLPHERGHGVVRVRDGLWVVHTGDRVIVKLDVNNGQELDRIVIPESEPEPHGLSKGILEDESDLLYCDATSGWVVQVVI